MAATKSPQLCLRIQITRAYAGLTIIFKCNELLCLKPVFNGACFEADSAPTLCAQGAYKIGAESASKYAPWETGFMVFIVGKLQKKRAEPVNVLSAHALFEQCVGISHLHLVSCEISLITSRQG